MQRIAVVLNDRANYGRLAPVMEALELHDRLELLTIVGGSMVLQRFGMPGADLPHRIDGTVYCEIEGSMPMSIGLATQGFAQQLERLEPDYCIVIGDRFETLGAATAAACLRIPLIHFQGGEVSGCLDNKWRHAITQMADYHVPANQECVDRVSAVDIACYGLDIEDGPLLDLMYKKVLAIGCPSSDLAAKIKYDEKPLGPMMVSFHPDTDSDRDHAADMEELLSAIREWRCAVYWPNIDHGSDGISKVIRRHKDGRHSSFATVINEDPDTYLRNLANTICCVGNSSSFVRDASFFGTPVVLVGDRQRGRECADNVLRVDCDKHAIAAAITQQVNHGRYPPSALYGDGHVTERFIKALETLCESSA